MTGKEGFSPVETTVRSLDFQPMISSFKCVYILLFCVVLYLWIIPFNSSHLTKVILWTCRNLPPSARHTKAQSQANVSESQMELDTWGKGLAGRRARPGKGATAEVCVLLLLLELPSKPSHQVDQLWTINSKSLFGTRMRTSPAPKYLRGCFVLSFHRWLCLACFCTCTKASLNYISLLLK